MTDESPSALKVRSFERKDKSLVPPEYAEWTKLFEEDKTIGALPKHQPWDHRIPLQEGKQPTFGPVYQLSQTELEELDRYIKEKPRKRIHKTVIFTGRIPHYLRSKEEWETTTICRL